jgi:hypothetical protein
MTTKMTAAQAAQQKNRSGVGQYQAKLNHERAGGLDRPNDPVVRAAFGAPEDHYEQFFQEHPEVPRGKARLLLHTFSDHVAQHPDSAWRDTLSSQLEEAASTLPANLVMGPDRGTGQAFDDAQSALRMVTYTWDRLNEERERAAEDLVTAAAEDRSNLSRISAAQLEQERERFIQDLVTAVGGDKVMLAKINAAHLEQQNLTLHEALREAAGGNPEMTARLDRLQEQADAHEALHRQGIDATHDKLTPQALGVALREAAGDHPEIAARRERLQELADNHDDYLYRERLAFHAALPHLSVEDADTAYDKLTRHILDNRDSEEIGDEIDRLAQQNAQAAGIQFDPTYRPPGARRTPGYSQGGAVVGEHYTGHMDITAVNKLARAEYKRAQDAGWLPPGLNISVRGRKFAGGQAMDVTIKGLTEDEIHETDHNGERTWTPQARELRDRLETIADAWNRNDTDSQIDYFDVEYYSHVNLDIY